MRRTVTLGRFDHEGLELSLGVLDRLADDAARRRDADVKQFELFLDGSDIALDPLRQRLARLAMRRDPGPDCIAGLARRSEPRIELRCSAVDALAEQPQALVHAVGPRRDRREIGRAAERERVWRSV